MTRPWARLKVKEQEAPVETPAPLAVPEPVKLFVPAPAQLFAPASAKLFAPAAAQLFAPVEMFGGVPLFAPEHKPAGNLFGGSGRNLFGRKGRKGRRLIRIVRAVGPIPPREKPTAQFWVPVCAFLECFTNEDNSTVNSWETSMWQPGGGFNFNEAMVSAGYQCAEECDYQNYHSQGHVPRFSEEDRYGLKYCLDHPLVASPFNKLEDTLAVCEHWAFIEVADIWAEALPLIRELRAVALEHVAELAPQMPSMEYIFNTAGLDWDAVNEPLDELVDAALHTNCESGLAALWADEMVLEFTETFGLTGRVLKGLFDKMEESVPIQRYPEQMIIFDRLHQPAIPDGHRGIELSGEYCITHTEYHSAIPRPQAVDLGFMGWALHHVVPCDQYGRIVPVGETLLTMSQKRLQAESERLRGVPQLRGPDNDG
jgi:hypothetical protein